MAAKKFEVGALVWLKGGSPPLTVRTVYATTISVCWLDNEGAMQDYDLPHECVQDTEPLLVPVESLANMKGKMQS